jgi:hypothetical protein
LSVVPGFEQYKLEQTDPHTYHLRLVAGSSDKSILERTVLTVLKDLYGSDSNIDIHIVKDIAPESSGKYLISRARFPLEIERYLDNNIEK